MFGCWWPQKADFAPCCASVVSKRNTVLLTCGLHSERDKDRHGL